MSNRNRRPEYADEPYITRNQSARRQNKRLRLLIAIGAIVLAVLIFVAILVFKKNTELVGVWSYDQYTQYEFRDGSSGCMCLDGKTHYEFSYSLRDNMLYIDFVLDYVTDCQYAYSLEENKLTLVGSVGTAEPGKVYELTKIN